MNTNQIAVVIVFAVTVSLSVGIFVAGIVGQIIDMFDTLPQIVWFYVWTTLLIGISITVSVGIRIAITLAKNH